MAFAFAQYAKQGLYLECKLSNYFKTTAEKCDCNKAAGFDNQEPVQPIPKIHTHLHLDELFPAARQVFFGVCHYIDSREFPSPGNEDESEGNHTTPYHPPRIQDQSAA